MVRPRCSGASVIHACQRQADHEQDEAHDLGRGLPAPGGNRQGDDAHEPRRQHGIDRLEGGHREGLAAGEPIIDHRGQGVGKAEIGPHRDHQHIEHPKGPEACGVAQRQESAAAHERPDPQHPAWAPAIQAPARPEAGRPALGPRQGKDERHGGVAGAKALADRGHEHGEAPIDGGLVQGAEHAAQPDHPPPVKQRGRGAWWGARRRGLTDVSPRASIAGRGAPGRVRGAGSAPAASAAARRPPTGGSGCARTGGARARGARGAPGPGAQRRHAGHLHPVRGCTYGGAVVRKIIGASSSPPIV